MRIFKYIFNTIFLVLMVSIAGLFLLPYLPLEHNLDLRIVESGSMEPAISTGSLTLVWPQARYEVGEVIMFDSRFSDVPTTHRIVDTYEERGETWFVTKGDANEEADNEVVPLSDVMGVVAVAVPRVGFVLDFARQPLGFLLLIVLPASLIVLTEIEKIWRELRQRRRSGPVGYRVPSRNRGPRDHKPPKPQPSRRPVTKVVFRPQGQMMDIRPKPKPVKPTLDLRSMPRYQSAPQKTSSWVARPQVVSVIVLFAMLVFGSSFIGSTVSYFNDVENSIENVLAAIALDFSAAADGEMFTFLDGDLVDDDGGVVVVVSPEHNSADRHYDVGVNVTSSSTVLCDAIVADSTLPLTYSGPLPLLTDTTVTFDVPWSITFTLPDTTGLTGGEICEADVVLTAWHEDMDPGAGYFDEEVVPLSFSYTTGSTFSAGISTGAVSLPSVLAASTSISSTTETASSTEADTDTVLASSTVRVHASDRSEHKRAERSERAEREEESEELERTGKKNKETKTKEKSAEDASEEKIESVSENKSPEKLDDSPTQPQVPIPDAEGEKKVEESADDDQAESEGEESRTEKAEPESELTDSAPPDESGMKE